MMDAFRLGGWGMYPTTIAGLVTLLAAVQYARRPDAARLLVVSILGVVTFLCGTLGFVTGVIKSITSSERIGDPFTTVLGFGESLHNIGLALSLLIVVAITAAVGAARASGLRPRLGEAPDLAERPRSV